MLASHAGDAGGPGTPGHADAGTGGAAELRRIRLMSVLPPVVFIVALQLACFELLRGNHLSQGGYVLLVVVPALIVVAFAHGMLRVIDRAQHHVVERNEELAQVNVELERRKSEGHAFYAVLLQISNQAPSAQVLEGLVSCAKQLLRSDGGGICLDDEAMFLVQLDEPVQTAGETGEEHAVCSVSDECTCECEGPGASCPKRRSPEWFTTLEVPVRGPSKALGELWVGRRNDTPYSERDREFLVSLSGLVEIALAGARARELEHEGAVLAERQRLAREMHDGVAQVLCVTHLRLRALAPSAEQAAGGAMAEELEELADLCQEAYQDVREAILGLRETAPADCGLLQSLRTYVEKFARQSGIPTHFISEVAQELELSPRCEVQLVRVVQEALTNVRKHSGAMRAVVRVTESPTSTLFTVEDDGAGFSVVEGAGHDSYGLQSMRDRMELLNGRLTIDSAPGHGTRVVAELPIHAAGRTLMTR